MKGNNVYLPPVGFVNYLELPNYELMVSRMPIPPIIANHFDTSTKEGVEKLNALVMTRYHGDTLSAVPKCNCGELTGGYNKGVVCKVCDTVCEDVLDKPLESTVWIEAPEGIPKFITPGVWILLSNALTKSGFNLLEWLVDPRYEDPKPGKPAAIIPELLGFTKKERNLVYFYENFESIMYRIVTYSIIRNKPKGIEGMTPEQIALAYQTMFDDHHAGVNILLTTPLGKKYPAEAELASFVRKYTKEKERVFSKYLPLPSALGIILETNNTGTWGETALLVALDAMYAVTQLGFTLKDVKLSMKNRRAVVCTKKMAEYSETFIKDTAGAKEGLFRRHICGGRIPFSMRAVIASINEPHSHDEIWLPWTPAVQFFRLDIVNKLFKRGFSPMQATRLIEDYTRQYHPLLDEIFKELIAESGGGVWVTFQRNPSIRKSSIQLVRVTRVKIDVTDRTISMPSNITVGPNADYDGDALHVMRLLDQRLVSRAYNLRPHRSVLSLDSPRSPGGVFKEQAPITLTVYHWLTGAI